CPKRLTISRPVNGDVHVDYCTVSEVLDILGRRNPSFANVLRFFKLSLRKDFPTREGERDNERICNHWQVPRFLNAVILPELLTQRLELSKDRVAGLAGELAAERGSDLDPEQVHWLTTELTAGGRAAALLAEWVAAIAARREADARAEMVSAKLAVE